MSYLFCAFVYDRKRFDPRAIVEVLNENYKPEDKYDALVKVPVKGTIDAIFMLPLRKNGLKSEAYFDRVEFLEDDFVHLLFEALSGGAGVVSPGVLPVVFAVAYSDMSDHNMLWKISPEGIDHRAVVEGEGHHVWMPREGESVDRHEDISVDAAEFGATEESDKDFREDEYHAEVARKEQPFSTAAALQEELKLKTARLRDAIERLEEGEKIWPEARKAIVKKASAPKKKAAVKKKIPAAKKKIPVASKTIAKRGSARKK
jgi:hypothetical protein